MGFLLKNKKNVFFSALKNIEKINLNYEDNDFKEFQKACEGIDFDSYTDLYSTCKLKTDFKFDNNDNLDSNYYFKFNNYVKLSNSNKKLSPLKLFLLITTVVFLAAVIFFAINLILEFLALSQALAIILAAIATVALVIFLTISIKNDVINKPQCFGGQKSFIDLYQNEEYKEKEPELKYINKEKEYDNK